MSRTTRLSYLSKKMLIQIVRYRPRKRLLKSKRRSRSSLFKLLNRKIVFLSLLGIILLLFIYYIKTESILTSYNVTLNTEIIEYKTNNNIPLNFFLKNAVIRDKDSILINKFNGNFSIDSGVDIRIERISKGPILMSFTAPNKKIGTLKNNINQKVFTLVRIEINDFESEINSGNSFLYIIDGHIKLTQNLFHQFFNDKSPIMRSGNVSMAGYSNLFNRKFDVKNYELYLGDRLEFNEIKENAIGFISVNENSGLQVSYKVLAKNAKILRPNPIDSETGIKIQATIIDSLIKAGGIREFTLLIGILVIFFSFASDLVNLESYFRKNK